MTVPSGLLPLHLENLLDIYPVSTSFLRETFDSSISLDYSQMFIAGAFKILTHKAYNRTATSIMVSNERQFTVPITIEVRIVHSTRFSIEDWCLASYSSQQRKWNCVSNLTETETQV